MLQFDKLMSQKGGGLEHSEFVASSNARMCHFCCNYQPCSSGSDNNRNVFQLLNRHKNIIEENVERPKRPGIQKCKEGAKRRNDGIRR